MKKTNKKSTTKKTTSKKTAKNVSDLVLQFAAKTGTTKEFSSTQLRAFVSKKNTETAPSTTDRILRSLRSNGRLNYTVTDRSKGRYRFTEISA